MNQHVDKIAENLYALTARKLKPLVAIVDEKNCYISHHGELGDYQLPNFCAGEDVTEHLPFLVGLENEDYVSLPIVNFSSDNVTSVDIIKINHLRYVVLLEAADEHDRHQIATQESNETKLLYEKLQRLTEELEIANEVKSRFISNMSHEFRTPLSSILGYSNLLAQNNSLAESESHHAKAIDRNAKYLLSLIDNVLEHAQLETDKILINIAPFAITELIVSIGLMFGAYAERSGIEFDIDTTENLPEAIYSDQIRLQQILINVIGNAFKYTEQGKVSVKFDWSQNELIVTIEDTGPGIDLEHQDDIFNAFSRYSVEGKKGAGLGLSISSQLAKKLNGNITLESHIGKGSIFTLVVNAEVASSVDRYDDKVSDRKNTKCVLVVEDDADLVDLLKIYIEDYGFNTIIAKDGKAAIDKCKNESIDLVLLDMQLPSIDGIEVTKQLRQSEFQIPIIGMTASSNNEDKVKAMNAGCNDFLSKPIQVNALVNSINNHIN